MSNLNIKLYFKKRKQRLSVFGFSPNFDWRVILILGGLLLIGGIMVATILYLQINDGTLFESVEDQTPKMEIEQKRIEIKNAVEQVERRSFDEATVN